MTAVGLVPHTGWAVLVRVAPGPRVLERARLVAVDPVTATELYHRAAERADGESWLLQARADALHRTIDAVRRVAGDAVAAAVVGKRSPIPPFAKVVAAHPRIHGAEGELWRQLFAEACVAAGLETVRVAAGGIAEPWLAEAGRALGAPWGAEHKQAAAAAVLGLPRV